jgi:coenzyme F420-reducing hydrogenase delta subunit
MDPLERSIQVDLPSLRAKRSNPVLRIRPLDCLAATAQQRFILSAAAGGVEGLLAMTDQPNPRTTSTNASP